MEIYYIEAGVLERMLTCFENLSTHVTDCMRENVVRNSENDWAVRMSNKMVRRLKVYEKKSDLMRTGIYTCPHFILHYLLYWFYH